MKSFTHILLVALMLGPYGASVAAPLSGTAGSNLTAYNPGLGSVSNNEWNSMINGRSSGTPAATADFGNCNSVILRCASPKCANGGCTSIDVATPIVAGCVASNAACKQYGDDLTNYIAAQLVANSTAKTNAQMVAAQNAAAEASAQQMQQMQNQMQQQMQQMQESMAAQNAQQIAQLQSALEEQQRATESALAQAAAASASAAAQSASNASASTNASTSGSASSGSDNNGLSDSQVAAASAGVSADILAREQVAGQILTSLERAQVNLNTAKAAMQDAFSYAGCTTSGDNCVGPKRVSVFRQKAMAFFDPYDAVLDELYDALITAQSVGVDITDIYMMLNGSCNVWGEYLCNGGMETSYGWKATKFDADRNPIEFTPDPSQTRQEWAKYTKDNCKSEGGPSSKYGFSRGLNKECYIGTTIPPEDSTACTLNRTLADMEEVQRNFLYAEAGDRDENIRIGCASSALESSKFFRNRKKGSSIDIETLERIVSQDAPAMFGSNRFGAALDPKIDGPKYCAVNPVSYMDLQKAASLKKLPSRICVSDRSLAATFSSQGAVSAAEYDAASKHFAVSDNDKGAYDDPGYNTESDCKLHQGSLSDADEKKVKDDPKANIKCECSSPRHWVKGNCILI